MRIQYVRTNESEDKGWKTKEKKKNKNTLHIQNNRGIIFMFQTFTISYPFGS